MIYDHEAVRWPPYSQMPSPPPCTAGGGGLVPSARFFRSVVLSLSSPFPIRVRASAVMATERRKLPEAWAAQLCPCWRRTSLPPGGKEPSTP